MCPLFFLFDERENSKSNKSNKEPNQVQLFYRKARLRVPSDNLGLTCTVLLL